MSANTWTYDLHGIMNSSKTAEFAGTDGSGCLLSPFYVGPANYATQTNENQKTIGEKAIQQFMSELPTQITKSLQDKGYTVLSVNVVAMSYAWKIKSKGTWYQFPIVALPLVECTLALDWTARVTLAQRLSQSPVPVWVFTLISTIGGLIIQALVYYWIINAIQNVLKSMTTTTSDVIEYNPDGTIKKETKTTGPDIGGIVALLGVLGLLGIGAYFAVSWRRRPKPTGRPNRKT